MAKEAYFTSKCRGGRTIYFDEVPNGFKVVQAVWQGRVVVPLAEAPTCMGQKAEVKAAVRKCSLCHPGNPNQTCVFKFVSSK